MLTLEQIDEILQELKDVEAFEDTQPIRVSKGTFDSLCRLARERLTAGTFQQGIEAAAQWNDGEVKRLTEGTAKYRNGGWHSQDDLERTILQEAATAIRNLKQEASNG